MNGPFVFDVNATGSSIRKLCMSGYYLRHPVEFLGCSGVMTTPLHETKYGHNVL